MQGRTAVRRSCARAGELVPDPNGAPVLEDVDVAIDIEHTANLYGETPAAEGWQLIEAGSYATVAHGQHIRD